jgi:hypothetical protein
MSEGDYKPELHRRQQISYNPDHGTRD